MNNATLHLIMGSLRPLTYNRGDFDMFEKVSTSKYKDQVHTKDNVIYPDPLTFKDDNQLRDIYDACTEEENSGLMSDVVEEYNSAWREEKREERYYTGFGK